MMPKCYLYPKSSVFEGSGFFDEVVVTQRQHINNECSRPGTDSGHFFSPSPAYYAKESKTIEFYIAWSRGLGLCVLGINTEPV